MIRPAASNHGDRADTPRPSEQFDVLSVCVQYQPDRVTGDEARVRQALIEALAGAEIHIGEENGRYENLTFDAASPDDALSKLWIVFDSPQFGRAARASCIVTCQGKHGWDDYLLLHHYDRTLFWMPRPSGLPNKPHTASARSSAVDGEPWVTQKSG
jgi:hypothetical protein